MDIYLGAYWVPIGVAAAPLLIACLAIAAFKPIARQWGLIDAPGGRKRHMVCTPLVGGIGIYLALLACAGGLSLTGLDVLPGGEVLALEAALVMTGVVDDRLHLGVRLRLGVQVAVALLLCHWAGIWIEDLGQLFGPGIIVLGVWGVPFTVFAVVGATNALNMVDGLDGLAGTLTGVSLALLLGVTAVAGTHPGEVLALVMVLSAIVGFLVHNARVGGHVRARIFMGDAGSLLLGFVMAYFLISLSQGGERVITPVTALWILGVPLLDTLRLMLSRVLNGHSPFAADRRHLHHLVLRMGFSVNQTVLLMAGLHLFLGMAGMLGLYLKAPEWLMFVAFLGIFALYIATTVRMVSILRWWRRRSRMLSGRLITQP